MEAAAAERVDSIEKRVAKLCTSFGVPNSAGGLRVLRAAYELGLTNPRLAVVPPGYYSSPLVRRCELIGPACASPAHLCKTILCENVRCTEEGWATPANSRYYLVVVQYTQRISFHALFNAIRRFGKEAGVGHSKQHYHIEVAPEETAVSLSGFEHNALVPIGLRNKGIPVILSKAIFDLEMPYIWLGGGEVLVKLGLDARQFVRVAKPFVADVSVPR